VGYASWASFGNFSSANSFVNSYGDMPYSRPLLIKLYGSFSLPYQFMSSFFYLHTDGSPWMRTVEVRPPDEWAAANDASRTSYTVNVNPPGTYRNEASDSLDLRLQKDFILGPGKLGIYMDVFNLLGAYTLTVGQNPAGVWKPDDAITTEGTFTPDATGLWGFYGSRQIRFSLSYKF
jgi:hypothetical protein